MALVFCLLLQRKATCKAKGKKKEQDTLVTWNFEPADFQPRTRQEILKLAAVSLSDMVRESVWLGSMAGKPGLEGGSWGGWEEGNRRRVRDRLRKTQQSWSCVHLHLWLANCNFHTLTIAHTGVDFYLDSSPVCDETQSRRSDRGAENVHWVSNILIILWDTDFSCFFFKRTCEYTYLYLSRCICPHRYIYLSYMYVVYIYIYIYVYHIFADIVFWYVKHMGV